MIKHTLTAPGYKSPECKTIELGLRRAILDVSITGDYGSIDDGEIGGGSGDPEDYDL